MITIGIPTYNEEKVIAKCILSALKQISQKDEILIVASGCTDNTIPKIQKIAKKDKRIKLIIEPERKGKSSALNLIIKNAKSDIIVQTDGDVEIQEKAIQKLIKHFKNPEIGGVSGNPIPILPKNNIFYDWTIMSYRKAGELRKKQSDKGNFWHMSGYLLAFRKKALPEVPFAKGAVDAWMGKIIKENGYKMIYEPEAKVLVKAPTTIKDFVKQKARVRAGYTLIPNPPRTAGSEIFYLPKELSKIQISKYPKFLFSGSIYLFSWIKGWYFAKTNKSLNQIWQAPESTK